MKFKMMLVLLALVMPTYVNALGLGKLELQSALNQPFKARVKLLSATADELDSLEVSLADREAFDRAGIQRLHGGVAGDARRHDCAPETRPF